MCKICNNSTEIILIDNVVYHFCPHCKFLAKTEMFIPSALEEYNRYLKHENNANDDYLNYQKKFYNDIKNFLGESVLDFGCGNNHILANILLENGYNCSYYDIYFYPEENYKKGRYDAIIMEEVIEHLANPLAVLEELISNLNDGGNLIIKTMFIPNDFKDKKWWYLRDTTHISFFDLKTFSYLSKLLSLQIIYCNDKDLIILQKAWLFLLLHIVRSGETIRVISDNYQCEISDITSNNLHITDFKNLKPGMKLRIPFLSKPIIETLEETESFVKDYYPNLDNKFTSDVVEEPKTDKIERTIEKTSPTNSLNVKSFGYYTGNIIPKIPSEYIKKI